MDNKKIGKLIASLRKKQGLTQQELGDKVGVGFRAVSKWERGINLPDIGIINHLSKTLGISSDELLSGEIKENKDNEKKTTRNIIIATVIALFVMFIILLTVFVYRFSNKTYVYNMASAKTDKYVIEGQVTFNSNKITIIINKLLFKDKTFSSIEINNYEYKILSNDTYLFGYGFSNLSLVEASRTTIKDVTENLRINSTVETDLSRKQIIENNIYLVITFLDTNNQEIIKDVEILLYENLQNSNKDS